MNTVGRMTGTTLKPPHLASSRSFLFAAASRDASKKVIHNLSSDSLNFNFPTKLPGNSERYTESCPTKRAAFSYQTDGPDPTRRAASSYQTDGPVPTKRAYFSYKTGRPLEEARPTTTRRGQFLPNGRLALKRPEPAAETATISYQTDGVTYSYLQRCRSSDTRPV
jgi:hypothetical protein